MFQGDEKDSNGPIETLIGEKTKIKGDLNFTGGLHIDGQVDGGVMANASSTAIVTISESGLVKGQLKAPVIVVDGRVEGDIHASERLELREKARISGNIHYKSIEMQLGAEVNGQLVYEGGSDVRLAPAAKPASQKS